MPPGPHLRSRLSLVWHRWMRIPITDLTAFQWQMPPDPLHEFSQNGEDGIIQAIFAMIGMTNKYAVEFGVEDGVQCNTRYLFLYQRWTGLWMDGRDQASVNAVRKEFVTAENIQDLFVKYGVPTEFDLLSIDIDGNDYWVWKAITNYRPRVVVIEYNAALPFEPSRVIPYDPAFVWDKTEYFGASLSALVQLGTQKGYTLVCTDRTGVNAFFVRDDLVRRNFARQSPVALYHPAAFHGIPGNKHPPDPKKRAWMEV